MHDSFSMIRKDSAFGDVYSIKVPVGRIPKIDIRSPQNVQSRALGGDPNGSTDEKNGMAKSILEYIFLGIALLIVTLIILRRFIILKRRNQPYTAFFRPDQHAQRPPNSTPNYTIASAAHRHGLDGHLSRYPAAYFGQGQRRTHAHDIDTSGRRLGNTTFLDHDGELGDKDALPAYDNVGGPPKYNELELQYRLSGVENGSSHPAEQSSIRITGGRVEAIPGDERQRALSLSSPRNFNNQGNVNDVAVRRSEPTSVE